MADHSLLIFVVVAAFFPVGLRVIAGEGMILSWFGQFMSKTEHLPQWLRKPLWTCERCMVSVWGLPAAAYVMYFPLWETWPILLVTAVGVQLLVDPA